MEGLGRRLAREQRAFLARPRRDWGEHLERARTFLNAGWALAEGGRPALVLGAGVGLEVPWQGAPKGSMGWDGDPWSRIRTALRHGRWLPWRFGDITGAMGPLAEAARRSTRESWSGRLREAWVARARLAAILPTLPVEPKELRQVLGEVRPGLIVAANVMGQFGEVARREVEAAFAPLDPWDEASELEAAFLAWHRRLLEAFLGVLDASGLPLVLLHDRAVLEGPEVPELGPFTERWTEQFRGTGIVEVHDPLSGVDALGFLAPRKPCRAERWWWPVGLGQVHLMEALAYGGGKDPKM